MKSSRTKKALPLKMREAWNKNERSLKGEYSAKNRSFLLGYKMAINEIFGWLEEED